MPRPNRIKLQDVGRPLIPIDWQKVDMWLQAGCQGTEIAARLNMHPNTFYERTLREKGVNFTEYSTRGDLSGASMLRSRQFQAAMQGNTRMMEILGKERLGQGRNNESVSPNDNSLAMIQDLLNKLKEKEEEINALKSQTDPILPASEEEIQHLGGSCEERQDICLDPETYRPD